jgi:hypothetical protein
MYGWDGWAGLGSSGLSYHIGVRRRTYFVIMASTQHVTALVGITRVHKDTHDSLLRAGALLLLIWEQATE